MSGMLGHAQSPLGIHHRVEVELGGGDGDHLARGPERAEHRRQEPAADQVGDGVNRSAR